MEGRMNNHNGGLSDIGISSCKSLDIIKLVSTKLETQLYSWMLAMEIGEGSGSKIWMLEFW